MIDQGKFYATLRGTLFASGLKQSQVDGTNALLMCWQQWSPGDDLRWLAYELATAWHETAQTMQPIEEYGHGRSRAYGTPAGPWHQVYDGRGDVQLTWETNYRHATQRLQQLGVLGADQDLEKQPELAMVPSVAGAVMMIGMREGWFTGKKLGDFLNNDQTDWVSARRIINGLDRAMLVASYAKEFYSALQAGAGPVAQT